MKKSYIYTLIATSMLAFGACTNIDNGGGDVPAGEEQPLAPFAEGELMVKFTPEVADIIETSGLVTRSGATRSGIVTLDEVLDVIGNYRLERVFPVDNRHEERTRTSELHQWYIVGFDKSQPIDDVVRRLSTLGEVQTIDLNRTVKRAYNGKAMPLSKERLAAAAAQSSMTRSSSDMNDECFPLQWNLINRGDMFVDTTLSKTVKSVVGADAGCEKAWTMSTGDPSVIVAVLDEGIFIEHPDLKEHIWVNEDEVADLYKDADGNGYKGDVYGYNFVNNTGAITWNNIADSGHGTHVAGTVSAVNNNGIGVSSIAGGDGSANGVRIMACQIFSGNVATTLLSTVRAIKYAADNGAVVLQCSWGYVSPEANGYDWGESYFSTQEDWEQGSPLEKEALDYFIHKAGSPNGPIEGGIAVFAGGNEYAPAAGFPGAAEDYVSVAATAADFTPAVYTNYGRGTTISAPGGDVDYYWDYKDESNSHGSKYGETGCILSTVPYHISETGYAYMEGTSMATPHVSSVVALGISYAAQLHKHFKATELQRLLHETAKPIDDYMTGTKLYYHYVSDLTPIIPVKLSLSAYKGKMGAGQVDAGAFLARIAGDDVGAPMRFPNIYVAVGGASAAIPATFFKGENLTFTITFEDESVATSTFTEDGKVVFKGVKSGVTKATITASNGESQSFAVTVRKTAGGAGWL